MPEESAARAEAPDGALRGARALARVARWALLAGALLHVAACLGVVALRIRYPFELEWMEGEQFQHVRRILEGKKLYVRPSLEFVPFMYSPLYYYVSAGVARLTGQSGFLPLRLVAMGCSLACFALIYAIVRRETGSHYAGALAMCLFVATFRASGYWFDLGRVDSLFLVCVLLALYLIGFTRSMASWVCAGVLVALSYLTKQTSLVIFAPVMAYCALVDRRRAAGFIAAAAGLIVVSTLVVDYLHDGWYWYYCFRVVAGHPIDPEIYMGFWKEDLLRAFTVACAAALFYMVGLFARRSSRRCAFFVVAAAGMVGSSYGSRLCRGTWLNVLFPAYAALAVLFALGVHKALEWARTASPARRWTAELFVYGACAVQFMLPAYNPLKQIPTKADLATGRRVMARLREMEGSVLVQNHSYLAVMAGRRGYAHGLAAWDVALTETVPGGALKEEIIAALKAQKFDVIICNGEEWGFDKETAPYYTFKGMLDEGKAFWPVTGAQYRPLGIFVPNPDAPPPNAPADTK